MTVPSNDEYSAYCRELETYLCRKNDGHLVRIVGPAFERVCAWAAQGVPLKVAFQGIDRFCERYHAKRVRRRPVRIEFCEADILELFDDWRRAVGVPATQEQDPDVARKPPLAAHIERTLARLVAQRPADGLAVPAAALDPIITELDTLTADARSARGQRRKDIVERLRALDYEMLSAAAATLDESTAVRLRAEAHAELAPFLPRMMAAARASTLQAGFERLVREAFALPTIAYD